MLERLRKMSLDAKKKVVVVCAGFLTLVILGVWGMHSFGVFSSAFESTKIQGVAVFDFLDQNVERAYNSFQNNAPSLNTASVIVASSTEEVDGTDIIDTSTTTEQ